MAMIKVQLRGVSPFAFTVLSLFPPSVHVNYKFPLPASSEEGSRWKSILKEKLNVKCRGLRLKPEKET